jgi:peptide/nickel transport system substrate-binding protein
LRTRSTGPFSRLDFRRGAVTKQIPVAAHPAGIAVGASAVWVASEESGTVLLLDPRSGKVVDAVEVGNGPVGIAVGEGDVWVANRQDGTVSRIDTTTDSVSATIPVGASPASVAVGGGGAWVANEGDGTIAHIDPDSRRVDETLSLESSPGAIALSGGNLWVATLPSLPSHRGGVLRVESAPSECRCTDPAYLSILVNLTDQNVITLSYDGLVAYRRVSGIAANVLVGDLAVRVPAPTDAGRTYTFQLRPDLRYSNGAPVRASDFRYSLERVLTVNRDFALHFYKGIRGAARCSAHPPERCDLSRGIEADDRCGDDHDPPHRGGPRLSRQAHVSACVRRPGRNAASRSKQAADSRHGPLPGRTLRARSGGAARSQPVLPPVVSGRASGRLSGRDPLPPQR